MMLLSRVSMKSKNHSLFLPIIALFFLPTLTHASILFENALDNTAVIYDGFTNIDNNLSNTQGFSFFNGVSIQNVSRVYISLCQEAVVDVEGYHVDITNEEIIAVSSGHFLVDCSAVSTSTPLVNWSWFDFSIPQTIGTAGPVDTGFFVDFEAGVGSNLNYFYFDNPSETGLYNIRSDDEFNDFAHQVTIRPAIRLDSGISTTSPQILQQQFNTRFTDVSISGSSSTVTFDIDYILDLSEYTNDTRPDFININVLADGFLSDQQVDVQKRLILPLTDGANNKVIVSNHEYIDGNYIAFLNFWNLNTDNLTFSRSNVTVEFEISGGVVDNFTITQLTDGLAVQDDTAYRDCSFTEIYGCFVNALIFVFVPDEDTFSQFTGLYTVIENKPPFGYNTAVKNALLGLNSSTTAAFSLSTIPFQDDIFDPFKSIMIIGLWVVYALFFMSRLDKLDI